MIGTKHRCLMVCLALLGIAAQPGPVGAQEPAAKSETPPAAAAQTPTLTNPTPAATPAPAATSLSPDTSTKASESEEKAKPAADAYVGIYVNQIYGMSLKENQFTADFYIWFRWTDADLNPIESFEVVNGRIESMKDVVKSEVPGGFYAYRRVVATISEFWDVSRFPLDNHTLVINIEDSDNEVEKLKYLPDTENSGMNPDVEVPGWSLEKPSAKVEPHSYSTNYGDPLRPTGVVSVYSRYEFDLALVRGGNGYFLKLFFGLFVATAISFLAFFIKPTEVDPRFGLGIGAIFAAVASEYVVTSSLPDTNVLTMADVLHMLAFIFIFISIAESTYSLKLYSSEDEAQIKRSIRLDHVSFAVLSIAYVGLSAMTVFWSFGLKL